MPLSGEPVFNTTPILATRISFSMPFCCHNVIEICVLERILGFPEWTHLTSLQSGGCQGVTAGWETLGRNISRKLSCSVLAVLRLILEKRIENIKLLFFPSSLQIFFSVQLQTRNYHNSHSSSSTGK